MPPALYHWPANRCPPHRMPRHPELASGIKEEDALQVAHDEGLSSPERGNSNIKHS